MTRQDEEPSHIDTRVGQRINLQRCILGLSQQHIAECLDIPINMVKAFESGLSRPTASQLVELCLALEIAPSWLFSDDPGEDEC